MQLHFVTTFNKYKSSKIMVVHLKLYIDKCFFYYKLKILNPLQRQFLQICSLLGRLIKDNLYLSCFVLTSSLINNSTQVSIIFEWKKNQIICISLRLVSACPHPSQGIIELSAVKERGASVRKRLWCQEELLLELCWKKKNGSFISWSPDNCIFSRRRVCTYL